VTVWVTRVINAPVTRTKPLCELEAVNEVDVRSLWPRILNTNWAGATAMNSVATESGPLPPLPVYFRGLLLVRSRDGSLFSCVT
jgi:hypothetical protein